MESLKLVSVTFIGIGVVMGGLPGVAHSQRSSSLFETFEISLHKMGIRCGKIPFSVQLEIRCMFACREILLDGVKLQTPGFAGEPTSTILAKVGQPLKLAKWTILINSHLYR